MQLFLSLLVASTQHRSLRETNGLWTVAANGSFTDHRSGLQMPNSFIVAFGLGSKWESVNTSPYGMHEKGFQYGVYTVLNNSRTIAYYWWDMLLFRVISSRHMSPSIPFLSVDPLALLRNAVHECPWRRWPELSLQHGGFALVRPYNIISK